MSCCQQTEALFQQVQREQGGRLDVLVNNAFHFMPHLQETANNMPPFWTDKSMYQVIEVGTPSSLVTDYNGDSEAQEAIERTFFSWTRSDLFGSSGFRNHYMCTCAAAPMLLQSKGLVVNISSLGAGRFLFTTPYGVGKCACE
jgi:dehydrogenase/reductase SDR family protein 1